MPPGNLGFPQILIFAAAPTTELSAHFYWEDTPTNLLRGATLPQTAAAQQGVFSVRAVDYVRCVADAPLGHAAAFGFASLQPPCSALV
jgi:hypothetical protein